MTANRGQGNKLREASHAVTLKKALAIDAIGGAQDRAGSAAHVLHHPGTNLGEIVHQLELGDGLGRFRRAPQLLIRVGNPNAEHHAALIAVLRSRARALRPRPLRVAVAILPGGPLPPRVGALSAGRHKWLRTAPFAVGDLLHAAPGSNGAVLRKERSVTLVHKSVAMFDQQPSVAFAVLTLALHAHQDPSPF